jgi:hypothetical protein
MVMGTGAVDFAGLLAFIFLNLIFTSTTNVVVCQGDYAGYAWFFEWRGYDNNFQSISVSA